MTTLLHRLLFTGATPAPTVEPLRQPTPKAEVDLLDHEAMAEYREVAQRVGVAAELFVIQDFRRFLAERDLPTFDRGEVIRYMDEITAKTNPTGYGWQWCPVRQKDAQIRATFGTKRYFNTNFLQNRNHLVYSDCYSDTTPPYTRVIPLHALKKIDLIERQFHAGDKVRFLVTDYVTAAHLQPDPFLMAVIPNHDVRTGVGCFIIDVWDEPGFGLEQRMKPG